MASSSFCFKATFVALLLFIFQNVLAQDPSWDHQTKTYNADFSPKNLTAKITLTPYFSPYAPTDLQTSLLLGATKSIDIGIPSFGSWSGCECGSGLTASSCSVSTVRHNESFPIFAVLLNAVHKGLTVRILTNNYNSPCPSGAIDPLTYLALAGAQVRYYTTTTYIHAKYMSVDGKRAAVSSVNFSYTSFQENREAGLLIEGDSALPVIQFLTNTFDFDFNQGGNWPTGTYSASDMQIINDKTVVPIPVPFDKSLNVYIPPVTAVSGNMEIEAIDSPDFAWETIFDGLNRTSKSFELYIYQVTTDDFCSKIQELSKKLSSFKMLVSRYIFDEADWKAATKCYTQLYNNGVKFYKTSKDFRYCHQKYWILDGEELYMSTGNWGNTDYPQGNNVYPPYGNSNWRNANRDFTIRVKNPSIVKIFKTVLDKDYEGGEPWKPYN